MDTQSNSIFRFILLLIFIGFAFLLFFLYQTRQKTEKQPIYTSLTPTVSRAAAPSPVVLKMGFFSLETSLDAATGEVDKALDLEIIAGSEQKSIVGYDVVVKFEEGAVDILSAKSLLPDFDLYPVARSDYYILTGTRKLESNEPTVFDNTPIARLTIMPKKIGALTIAIADNLGLEKSQLVDDKTQILIPQVGEITIKIK